MALPGKTPGESMAIPAKQELIFKKTKQYNNAQDSSVMAD